MNASLSKTLEQNNTLFYKNGRIYIGDFSVESRENFAYGMLVQNGVIERMIQTAQEYEALRNTINAQEIDLHGRWVFPGFIDAHNHPGSHSRTLVEIDFRERTLTWSEATQEILACAKNADPQQWIVVHGWNTTTWSHLNTQELDKLAITQPLIIANISYHSGVVNTRGVEMLIEKNSIDSFEVTQDGIFHERIFERAFDSTAPDASTYAHALHQWYINAAAKGITTIHDCEVRSWQQLEAFIMLEQQNRTVMPTLLYITPALLQSQQDQERIQHLLQNQSKWENTHIIGLKLMLDGAFGGHSAALNTQYTDKDTQGILSMTNQEIRDAVDAAVSLGLTSIAMHCIGDAAIELATQSSIELRKSYPNLNFRFEHYELPSQTHIELAAKHGFILCPQPNFLWDAANYSKRLGHDRVAQLIPLRAMIDSGAKVIFGSDDMPTGPIEGIDWATRRAPFASQQITRLEALRLYTIDPATHIPFSDPSLHGQLRAHTKCNAVIFEKNILEISDEDFANIKSISTILNGNILHP